MLRLGRDLRIHHICLYRWGIHLEIIGGDKARGEVGVDIFLGSPNGLHLFNRTIGWENPSFELGE